MGSRKDWRDGFRCQQGAKISNHYKLFRPCCQVIVTFFRLGLAKFGARNEYPPITAVGISTCLLQLPQPESLLRHDSGQHILTYRDATKTVTHVPLQILVGGRFSWLSYHGA